MPDSDSYEDTDDEMKAPPRLPAPPRSPSPPKVAFKKIKMEIVEEDDVHAVAEGPRSPSPPKVSFKKIKMEVVEEHSVQPVADAPRSPSPPKRVQMRKVKREVFEPDDILKYFENMTEYTEWRSKKEIVREQEIFERMEQYNRKMERKAIQEKLETKRRASEYADAAEDKKKKAKKSKNKLSVADVFGADVSESESDSSSSDESESSSSSDDEVEEGQISSSEEAEQTEDKQEPRVAARQELEQAIMTRQQLAKIVHAPFFAEIVTGAFVVINIGRVRGLPPLIVGEVLKVMQTPKIYDLEDTKTNKTLNVRFGNFEGNFRLRFISNKPVCPDALFEEFLSRSTTANTLPSVASLSAKRKQIQGALDRGFSEQELALMIEEKKRFNKTHENRGVRKFKLLGKLQFAEENGLTEEAQKWQEEIRKMDADNDTPANEQIRSGILETILKATVPNPINSRLSANPKVKRPMQSDLGDDPFTRKRARPKVVTTSGSRTKLPSKHSPEPSPKPPKMASRPVTIEPKPATVLKSKVDHFELYNSVSFDIDIRLPVISPH